MTLQEQGKTEEAIGAYRKALLIKPFFAEAYYNMGVTLQQQGKIEEAIESYTKALSINSEYPEAHRNLSILTKYYPSNPQIMEVDALLKRSNLKDSDRCHLHYTFAKIKEDLGDLSSAFENYVAGGELRQKLLTYEFAQDQLLFGKIKAEASNFKAAATDISCQANKPTPIFIIGMPRSGTTLIEQILSSHSKVTGAGELKYVESFGVGLAVGSTYPTAGNIVKFRKKYLGELTKCADGREFVTDKMPQNFRFISLICAALPEAKIIHVRRDPRATCWSNFKHYFISDSLGYSYNLADTAKYYELYLDLMQFWSQSYGDRIYNLDYDKLTKDQEQETRRLVEYLELNWEDSCLSPHKNKRSVRTASQQQVREKVYQGSSEAWRAYEQYLDGAFDSLGSL